MTNQQLVFKNMQIGKILKLLRQAKGFTVKEAAGSALSRPHLTNVENGKAEISAHKLLHVLQNINVSVLEFEIFYLDYINFDHISNSDLAKAYMSKNITQLEYFLRRAKKKCERTPAIKRDILDNLRITALLATLSPKYHVSDEDSQYLSEYLSNLKQWGQYDIQLFGQCLSILEARTIFTLTSTMMAPTQLTTKLPYNKHAMIQTSINVIAYYLEHDELVLAENIIKQLESVEIQEHFMYEKLIFNFYKNVLSLKKGDEKAIFDLLTLQHAFEDGDCFQTANQIAQEIELFENTKQGILD